MIRYCPGKEYIDQKRGTARAIGFVATIALISGASAEQCPAGFDGFIEAFESSTEFQVAHSKYPLAYQYMDTDATGEPKLVQVAVTRESLGEFAGVQFPSSAQRAQESLQLAVTRLDEKTRVVRLWLQDSDFEIKYVFERTSACWELTGVADGVF